MCFIISIVSLILSYNFFMAGSLMGGVGALLVALFFVYLMIKNILFVKNLKNKKRDELDN
jgi:hypothetical protein